MPRRLDDRVVLAVKRACPRRRLRPYRLGNAFDFPGPEVLQLEEIARLPALRSIATQA